MNITEAIGSGPRLGKPVFGKQMFSGDFEALWKEEEAEEGVKGEQPSEYDLVFASIKRELTGYAGAIIHTLRSLRQNIEKMVPSDTAKQVREELEHILTPRDFDRDVISEVLRAYLTEVLGRRSIPEISPILYGIVKEGPSDPSPMKIGVKGRDGVEYLYLVRLVDESDGREFLRSERKAMEIVMELERERLERKYGPNSNWKVEDVSLKEHYDIKVIEPEGEKYIEVKGHKPLLLTAEITPAEYKFATDSENVDKYWIYIVANLGKKKPVILKIFRPFDPNRKVYAVLEDGKEVEITGKVSIDVKTKTRVVMALK